MTGSAVARQPGVFNDRRELREIFNQYLQVDREAEHMDWQSITTRDGLPHNWIYDLYQDAQERIWAGTWGGGVACFSGGHWKVYSTADGLHCNEVTCIRQDASGRIWLATDNGLNILEGDRFINGGLAGKSLLNITFDRQGNLWAGCWRAAHSGGGLFRFDGHGWAAFTTRNELPGLEILKVYADSQGRLWVGTYEQGAGAGVGYYDGTQWHNFSSRHGLANDCVYSMFEDPSGNIWFGTLSGVSIYDGKSWHTLSTRDGLVDDHIYSMLIDSRKKMWFGTEGGISRFDGKNWISFTTRDGLVNNLVRTIVEARDGSLWFGAYPYAVGTGGISVGRYREIKSLTDRVIDLLPELPPLKQLPGENPADEPG